MALCEKFFGYKKRGRGVTRRQRLPSEGLDISPGHTVSCVSVFWFCVFVFWFCVSVFWYCVSVFWFCVFVFWFCVSVSWFCVSVF